MNTYSIVKERSCCGGLWEVGRGMLCFFGVGGRGMVKLGDLVVSQGWGGG